MTKALKHYGVISKKVRWGLTPWGWLAILAIIFSLVILMMSQVYNYLAPVHREKTDVLILEGFVSDYVLRDAIQEFKDHHYRLLITTGTPLEWGHLLVQYENTARVAAISLQKMGFDSSKLIVVTSNEIRNDRTFNSALELGQYLRNYQPEVTAINLMTMSVHGRRSQMLFQYALGDSIRVGIISSKNFYYGPSNWWRSSKGFREVMNEAFGALYVKFFFRPYSFGEKDEGRRTRDEGRRTRDEGRGNE